MLLRRGQCDTEERTVCCCGQDCFTEETCATKERRRGHCITEERTVCY